MSASREVVECGSGVVEETLFVDRLGSCALRQVVEWESGVVKEMVLVDHHGS